MHRLLFRIFLLGLFSLPLCLGAATPMVEGGADFSLFLSREGTVQAAGSDASGQLGQGRPLTSEVPVTAKLSAVFRVASGASHSLGLKSDGSVWAWGANAEGQLGDGTTQSRSLPQQIGSISRARAVAAGQYHSVAAMLDGSVRTWGSNRYGQLGDGSLSTRKTPVAITGIAGVNSVAAGYNHTLALKSDGTVLAWGGNDWGQLGNGNDLDSKVPVQVMLSGGLPLGNIVAIAAGHSFSVAVDRDGKVFIWGYLYTTDTGTRWVSTAQLKTDVPAAKDVVAGRDHALVLARDDYVWAWGGNYWGQVGNGTDNATSRVTSIDAFLVLNLSGVQSIAAGHNHSLAVKGDGTVWRWGFTRYDPDLDTNWFFSLPDQVDTAGGSQVAGGSSHSLALLTNGQVIAWGNNADGQFGDGALLVRSVPAALANLSGVTEVSAGGNHGLALKSDGSVWAWGRGRDGQLGNGGGTDVPRPAAIGGLSNIARIAAADKHSLAIKSDGTVLAWGNNYYGQLGDGTDTDRTSPVQVKTQVNGINVPLPNIVAVCGGEWHSAAVDSSGTVWRWGYHYYSDSEDVVYYTPRAVRITNIPASSSLVCGAGFTLVLARDGTVWAWGDNYYGQMGDGTDINSYPDLSYSLQVRNLTNVRQVAAGHYHSLALKNDGTVWRWGYSHTDTATGINYYDPLPVAQEGLDQVSAIGAGNWHSLALKSDGTVLTWGFNYAGQLADGAFEHFRNSPLLAINSTANGLLDLDTTVANNVSCPMVVQADKSGSIDAITAGFRLYVGTQANCLANRAAASSGYQVFVAAIHPTSGMWLLKGVENGATLPAKTWTQYLGGPLPMFAANAGAAGLDDHVQATLFSGFDTRVLAGFDVYIGYGVDAGEMLGAGRVKRIFSLGVDGRPVTQR